MFCALKSRGDEEPFASGHGLPCRRRSGMDGLPSIAEGRRPARVTRQLDPNYRTNPSGSWHGRMCQEATYAPQKKASLFDHLIRAGQQHRGHFDAERFGGLQIDDQIVLGRLHDR